MDIEKRILDAKAAQGLDVMDAVVDGKLVTSIPSGLVMVEASTDLTELGDYPPGTIAFTAGYKGVWQLNGDKTAWYSLLTSDVIEMPEPDTDDEEGDGGDE